jgi:hypothetical protein
MISRIDAAIAKLEPIKDRVLLRPLDEPEVIRLEGEIGPLPSCLRRYYQRVGIFEDLTSYGASEFEVQHRFEAITDFAESLRDEVGDPSAVPFGDDGAGNQIYVTPVTPCDRLFFFDRETRQVSEVGPFCEWLENTVAAALATPDARAPNMTKRWYVQFSFEGPSEVPILSAFGRITDVSPSNDWRITGTSPANVTSAELPFLWGSQRLVLKRLTYPSWQFPHFFVDYSEPVLLPAAVSVIRVLDAMFEADQSLRYKRVDYGRCLKTTRLSSCGALVAA